MLFASGSVRELLQRISALQQLLTYDASLIDRFERDLDIFTHVAEERGVSVDQVEASYYEFRS